MPSVSRGSDDFDTQGINATTAKAWVNFDGTGTPSIRDSHNVDSITDVNTGDYTVNFTNDLGDANYTINTSIGPAINNSKVVHVHSPTGTPTVSGFSIRCKNGSTNDNLGGIGDADYTYISCTVFSNS